jgi:hypothetical protein
VAGIALTEALAWQQAGISSAAKAVAHISRAMTTLGKERRCYVCRYSAERKEERKRRLMKRK